MPADVARMNIAQRHEKAGTKDIRRHRVLRYFPPRLLGRVSLSMKKKKKKGKKEKIGKVVLRSET